MIHSDVIDIFKEIVQIDSITGEEVHISRDIQKRLEKMGIDATIDDCGNVISFVPGDDSQEPLFLNAHLDTVEPGRGIEPYIDDEGYLRSKGETILGADNKTAVAAILAALKLLADEDFKHNCPLEVVFTTSEESGSHGAVGLDYSQLKSTKGYSSDASNRTPGEIIIASPFYNRFDIELKGIAAHASRPDIAKNVIPVFVEAVSQIELGRVNEDTLVNIGVVQSGDVVNTIPGSMIVSGEVRSMIEDDVEKYTQSLVTSFEQSGNKYGVKVISNVVRENDGFKLSKDNEFVQETISKLNRIDGMEPKLSISWGCYDANIFVTHGITVLNIADGSKDSHTVDERIKVEHLENLARVFYHITRSE